MTPKNHMTRPEIRRKQKAIEKEIDRLRDQKKYQKIAELMALSQQLAKEAYALMPFKEKVTYWAQGIHDSMRSFGEQGHDEMSVFSKREYEIWKSEEPNIDEFLPHILNQLRINHDKVYPLLEK